MASIYIHLPQGEDIGPEGRSYSITEDIFEYKGRKILFLYVTASEISFCDRNYAAHLANVNVKGYILKWKYGENEKGEMLSEIEPITDKKDERAISELLRASHNVTTVNFI